MIRYQQHASAGSATWPKPFSPPRALVPFAVSTLPPMALISPSPTSVRLHVRAQLTTTTVFANPTALGSTVPDHTPIPIAAIAAGSAAGVVLAVLAVIGWKYWGRQIKKQERQELEKRKAKQAAVAYRRSVLGGRKLPPSYSGPRRSPLTSSTKAPSDRKVQFAGVTVTSPLAFSTSQPIPDQIISPPKPLRPRTISSSSGSSAGEKDSRSPASPLLPIKTPLTNPGRKLGSYSYKPLRPSPLASPPSPRPPEKDEREGAYSGGIPAGSMTGVGSRLTETRVDVDGKPGSGRSAPSAAGRILRMKASLVSLTGEARRQSKASQNSASDQSRHSSAEGSARRWSWWSLINGPGLALRQIAVGTGRNRLSADTSLYTDWREDDPSLPIGYAYDGVEVSELRQEGPDADAQTNYIFVDPDRPTQGTGRV